MCEHLNYQIGTVGQMETLNKPLHMTNLRIQTTCKHIGNMRHGAASLGIEVQLYGVVAIRQQGYAKAFFPVSINHARLLSMLKPGVQAFRSNSHTFVLVVQPV